MADAALHAVSLGDGDTQLAFTAADTLYVKVKYDFYQLPPEARMPFRDSVLAHIRKFVPVAADSPTHPAFGRLCLVVAQLCIRMQEWSDPVRSLVANVGLTPATLASIFNILAFVVEEVRCTVLRRPFAPSSLRPPTTRPLTSSYPCFPPTHPPMLAHPAVLHTREHHPQRYPPSLLAPDLQMCLPGAWCPVPHVLRCRSIAVGTHRVCPWPSPT